MRQLYYTSRTLLNRRGLNLAKIISLTLGLFIGILLFARVTFEFGFDNHYYEADKLCAVNVTVHYKDGEKKGPYPTVMAPVPAAISENFPEILSRLQWCVCKVVVILCSMEVLVWSLRSFFGRFSFFSDDGY